MDSAKRPPLHVSRSAVALVAVLALLPWAAVFLLIDRSPEPPAAPPPTVPAADATESNGATLLSKPGPWGELVISRILIEPPENLLPTPSASAAPYAWTVHGMSPEAFRAWLAEVPLSEAARTEIADQSRWQATGDVTVFRPSTETVASLSPEARGKIYTLLSNFSENAVEAAPFRFRADAADEWFAESDLRPETIALVKKFLYQRGASLLFSDTNLVFPQLPSQAERVRLVKTLSRKSTLMVKLRLRPDTDVEALAEYWGRGQRSRDLLPLLRSLQPKKGVAHIDLIHLLPRMPRQFLYTYPLPNERGRDSFMDCHWTSLNFFNVQPERLYEEVTELQRAFSNDYFMISTRPSFGDVLLFMRSDNTVLHSCVYVADDIVFTKNGAQPNAPWILMSLADVIAYYPSDPPLEIFYYRAKRLETP